jgi:hypothetical protein
MEPLSHLQPQPDFKPVAAQRFLQPRHPVFPVLEDWERRSVALKPEYLPKLAAILNVSVDYLLGIRLTSQRGAGPAGKARQIFEAVSRLPRKQQQKVIEMAEGFLALHQAKSHVR